MTTTKPLPLGSLVAAATRLTGKKIKRAGISKTEAWQEDAWDMYDLVGEQRFLATTLANRMGQARFFVGKVPSDRTEDIIPETDGPAFETFNSMASNTAHFSQMVTRTGLNLFMPGDCYLLGAPDLPDTPESRPLSTGISPLGGQEDATLSDIDLDSLTWRVLSISECKIDSTSGAITVTGHGANATYDADKVVLIRVWRPHPRHWSRADSPTRSSLPVLRELVGLTMHISAQVDSRLAGAGLLLIPASADAAVRQGADPTDGDQSPIAEALQEAMITPIGDRSSASAVVPLSITVPDEAIDKFRLMTFAGALDAEARNLRDEAIRRLALGQDCPPELLLGTGSINHWGMWLIQEDVVSSHLEPPLALICDAITTQFLHPVLEQQGIEDFADYAVWYDVDHMISRPNRSQDAALAHTAGVINDTALRDALGFDVTDAPEVDPTDPVVALVLSMIRDAPSLAQTPGLDVIAEQVRALIAQRPIPPLPGAAPLDTEEATAPDRAEPDVSTESAVPETAEDPALVASGYRTWCGVTFEHDPHYPLIDGKYARCEGVPA